jgi:Flp pilus assembly protein TadD
MLQRFGTTDDAHQANSIAWACILAPDAVADPKRVVALAQTAVAGSNKLAPVHQQAMLNTLGAAHYRAGQFESAIARLNEAARTHPQGGTAGDWFFLAMAHAQLGNQAQADRCYDRAISWKAENQPAIQKNRRLAEEVSRFEAEAAVVLRKEPAKPP